MIRPAGQRWIVFLIFLDVLVAFLCLNLLFKLSATTSQESSSSLQDYPMNPTVSLSPKTRHIMFVHVGKTGGITIRKQLRNVCALQCSDVFPQNKTIPLSLEDESVLSRQVRWKFHCLTLPPIEKFDLMTSFLFVVRDPIDRLVSWFLYQHPRNCDPVAVVHCDRRINSEPVRKAFFACFDQMDDWARALADPDPHDNCSRLAMDFATGRGPLKESNHLFFNYQYYANYTIRAHPDKEVLVIRTESLWDDFHKLDAWIGGRGYGYDRDGNHTHMETSPKAVTDRTISDLGIWGLCCALSNEIKIYEELLDRAANIFDNAITTRVNRCASMIMSKPCPDVWYDD